MKVCKLSWYFSFIFCFLLFAGQALAQGKAVTGEETAQPVVSPETARRLTELSDAIADQRQRLDELAAVLKKSADPAEKQALEQQLEEGKARVVKLRGAIEQIVIGGVDVSVLADKPPEKIDWRAELEQISMPILATLREITAKPRRIESLRKDLALLDDRLAVIHEALASIAAFEEAQVSADVAKRVTAIGEDWRSREAEISQSLEVARLQLANLTGQAESAWISVWEAFVEFGKGRGLTLVLAVVVGLVTWALLRGARVLYERVSRAQRGRARTTRLRVVEYAFRAVTAVLVTLSVVAVFYVRSDVLLMALSVVVLIGLALALRQVVPRYLRETRLLLDIGPVREGERLVVDGVPYKVSALNVTAILRNPRLDGFLRVPLAALDGMVSRPVKDEPWFPTRAGDCVLLADGTFGQVISQSIEFVQLRVMNSIVNFPTAAFLTQGVHNLSEAGFGISVTFGIDYRHQQIALDVVPEAFRSAVSAALDEAGVTAHVEEIVVDFKEAATNSLDYLVYVVLQGTAASRYFKLSRLVQQACVRLCNERGWIIPFNQLTVHRGEGFEGIELSSRSP